MSNALSVLRWVRRLIVFVIGATVTLFGVVLFFTPGPAIIVIPLGLMILATEFAWARVILTRVKDKIARMRAPAKPPGAKDSAPGGPADEV